MKIWVYCILKKMWEEYTYCQGSCEHYDKHNEECNYFGGCKGGD